jgi:hypothetical protein
MALALLATAVFVSTDALAQAPAVDSAAVQKFKRMTEFLDGVPKFTVNTQSSQLLNEQLFYDGTTLSLYRPSEGTYATATAPGTIEKIVDFARETVGILLPAADLVYRGAFPLMMQDVSLAAVFGQTVIGGVKCDHLLFSRRSSRDKDREACGPCMPDPAYPEGVPRLVAACRTGARIGDRG